MLKKRLGVKVIERDWHLEKGRLRDCIKVPSILIIPEGVVKVGRQAFWGCDEIKKVIIPEGVKEIGRSAFNLCKNLREAVIPESVEKIDSWAFFECKKATIILKKPRSKFKEIGVYAFECCRDVKEKIRG